VGLHVCGDLLPQMAQLFCQTDEIRAFIGVGCCYYRMADKKDKHQFEIFGHPMSSAVKRIGVTLSAGGLALACESVDTWCAMNASEFDWMLRATFYRCVLEQWMSSLLESQHNSHLLWHVRGVPRAKCTSFAAYMTAVLPKLRSQLGTDVIPDVGFEQMDALWTTYSSSMPLLRSYLTLRTVMSAVLESYVVLDRYLYLREFAATRACTVELHPLFEPQHSPRNLVLVAVKH